MNNAISKSSLSGKNILLLAWEFYDYPDMILDTIEQLGGSVTYINSVSSKSHLMMKLKKTIPFLNRQYENRTLETLANKSFDYLFVVNPALFEIQFLNKLEKIVKFNYKVAYLWDSINTFPEVTARFPLFDQIFSFDPDDCNQNDQLTFLPLFYEDRLADTSVHTDVDFSFVGFAHSQRYDFTQKIRKLATKNNMTCDFRLYLPSVLYYLRGKFVTHIFDGAKASDFMFTPLSKLDTQKVMESSKVVVDMQLDNQVGLTMRTIETLGMKRKLITTNTNISKYDFYNPNNILIVARDNPQIPVSFVAGAYEDIPASIFRQYSLTSWVRTIFNLEGGNNEAKYNHPSL